MICYFIFCNKSINNISIKDILKLIIILLIDQLLEEIEILLILYNNIFN